VQLAYVERRLNTLEKLLEGKQYASGGKFSIADAYLFTILTGPACTRSISPSGRTSRPSRRASPPGPRCRNDEGGRAWPINGSTWSALFRVSAPCKRNGQAAIHAVIDVGVVVVEFLVAVPDCGRGEARGQDARSVLDVIRSRHRIDVDAAQRLQVVAVSRDEVDRVVPAPLLPALLYRLPRLEVERNAEAERRLRIRIVGRRHAQFMMQWTSARESFSFFRTCERNRLMRPSSLPSARPLRFDSRSAS